MTFQGCGTQGVHGSRTSRPLGCDKLRSRDWDAMVRDNLVLTLQGEASNLCHCDIGNFGDVVARVAIKWFFQVRIQRSALLAR